MDLEAEFSGSIQLQHDYDFFCFQVMNLGIPLPTASRLCSTLPSFHREPSSSGCISCRECDCRRHSAAKVQSVERLNQVVKGGEQATRCNTVNNQYSVSKLRKTGAGLCSELIT